MHETLTISSIGHSQMINGQFAIQLTPEHREGLAGLKKFSHAIALWWAHEADSAELRARLTVDSPYTACTDDFGVFSTRSEARPNPIGLSVFAVASVDPETGTVFSHYFDMLHQTPILDLKPYFPASDRVTDVQIPRHFSHWPTSLEESAGFDWSKEFRA